MQEGFSICVGCSTKRTQYLFCDHFFREILLLLLADSSIDIDAALLQLLAPFRLCYQYDPVVACYLKKKKTKYLFYFILDKALQPGRLFRRSHTDKSR